MTEIFYFFFRSRMFSSCSNSNNNNNKNSTNALHAFSTFLSAKAASPSVSTSAKQLLQQLNAEVSNCSDSKRENSMHNTSHSSGSHCTNSQHADPSHQGSNGGAPVRKTYTEAELTKAVRAILHGKLGTRRASAEFGIPRSTLRNKICKLNEMKRKEEEVTGRRIEMEDFLESVINTPIFQVRYPCIASKVRCLVLVKKEKIIIIIFDVRRLLTTYFNNLRS